MMKVRMPVITGMKEAQPAYFSRLDLLVVHHILLGLPTPDVISDVGRQIIIVHFQTLAKLP